MADILKGNYKLNQDKLKQTRLGDSKSLESEFEASALEKLGGSIAFVKKSGSFVWKGDKKS